MALKTHNTDYDTLINNLPQDEERIKKINAILIFRPQKWGTNGAQDVRQHRQKFTVPLADLYNTATNNYSKIHKSILGHWVSDSLKSHENAPKIAQTWDGPFEIKLTDWEKKTMPKESTHH